MRKQCRNKQRQWWCYEAELMIGIAPGKPRPRSIVEAPEVAAVPEVCEDGASARKQIVQNMKDEYLPAKHKQDNSQQPGRSLTGMLCVIMHCAPLC